MYLYYGANSGTECSVTANARLAVSNDGINFSELGEVFSGTDRSIWGSGDELFPVGAYEFGGIWSVFYIPNGVSESRKLGVISGNAPDNLTESFPVNNGSLPAWGAISIFSSGANWYFVTNETSGNLPITVYGFSPSDPTTATQKKVYSFNDCARASILYEPETSRWLMLCRELDLSAFYRVKTASISKLPTETPTNVLKQGDANGDGSIDGKVNGLEYIVCLQNFEPRSYFMLN